MEPYTLYLAGLIDTTQPECAEWRTAAEEYVKTYMPHVRVWNPLAAHTDLARNTSDNGITSNDNTSGDIVLRDYRAVSKCDLIVVNLEVWKSKRPLVGTVCELAWAWERKTPVIAVCNEANYLMRKHPFISSFVAHYFATLESAMTHVRWSHVRSV